jgi:hypothetical protein
MPAMRSSWKKCTTLHSPMWKITVGVALLSEINAIWQNEFHNNENFTDLSEVDQLQLLMDNTIKVKPTKKNSASVARLEGLSSKLMFKLHIKRRNFWRVIETKYRQQWRTGTNIAKRGRGDLESSGDCPRIHYNKLIIVLDFRLWKMTF